MVPGATVGDALTQFAPWSGQALLVGVASARFAFAFLMVPLFSTTIIPAMVRNSLIIAFGLVALSLPIQFDPSTLSSGQWLLLYAREAAAGITIGFFFGSLLWALGAAGEIIDTKVGATIGQLVDPLTGLQESITANLLSRFGQIIFVSAGGLTLFVGTIMASYAAWPMRPEGVSLNMAAVSLFEGEFGWLFARAFIIAAPALTVLYVIDGGMGLLNRFAQQFNVFSLSMPIKAAASIFVLIMLIPLLANVVIEDLSTRADVSGMVLDAIRSENAPDRGQRAPVGTVPSAIPSGPAPPPAPKEAP